ncbi:trehalase family glycosidase [Acidipila sp. EB88]|uniref:MGH1-like glycoside hydrolase domain-containing protein n=1 Tax=Acidipila sp. EB88 TaxID=2305226 RepID=UPI000F5DCC67|nr:trehalase family glycosidase [Acidipila sp. EB88]RRA48519.1 hypothetical protein D1Y84_09680 [Acidipila sp. EB88]
MKSRSRRLTVVAAAILVSCTPQCALASNGSAVRAEWPIQDMPNLLDLHHEPASPSDRSPAMFFDQGAWHGYALPSIADASTGFIGPFLGATGGGLWTGGRFAVLTLHDATTGKAIPLAACDDGGVALAGALVRNACGAGIAATETLFYASASTTLVHVTLRADHPTLVRVSLGGTQPGNVLAAGDSLTEKVPGIEVQPAHSQGGSYSFTLPDATRLEAHTPATLYLEQTYLPGTSGARLQPWTGDPEEAWALAGERWQHYLQKSAQLLPALTHRDDVRRINRKAVITLLGNWRAPLGDLQHAGLFPSYSNPDFNAFWAWDSWKHAAALARFAPELAKDQVRALFDCQLPDGMIPDKISRSRAENNLRDSKPPLAAWAVSAIYTQTHDRAFVAEMFDRLYHYHQWWYTSRDHDHNGLAEYGATDGTLEAARWESGMDNAVRFDHARMLKNTDAAWSLDQESVDLNCYLYQEKLELADMAALLGKNTLAQRLRKEAADLRKRIQQVFYDASAGYFFDVHLGDQSRIRAYGPEGWIPLWTKVASQEQATRAIAIMSDPDKFDTHFPFPTLAKDDPLFTPGAGYWRGPVWIDQAVFAIQGMENYSAAATVHRMRDKLLSNSPGLSGAEPFRETYNPVTGAGQNSFNFSWSAAEYYLLIHPRR